ncbi:fusaric acid resistance protein FusB [Neoasaia chiangmaiensis NBRC 101099]|nr:FUSC family protein [Neoasaia chiangmaiensis]GBR40689.1 fusaric acid resistance protein FusB [Neoasaia chiangmaiensis NBRC 101099]GEN13786.1 hypothetical protein NCH01_02170 [Neoasaia chiangmaiensis]
MERQAEGGLRWWPRLADLPPGAFPPGWISFSLRTWLALVLALAAAFWAQIDAPAGAGVSVMILAQPFRGQALSKALYRLLGTAAGVVASVLLAAAFGQDRPLFLGGVALWLAFCAFIGTLERDFRSYGALLAGYTVALVALNNIDGPQNVFDVAMARASAIGIGVASIAVVNSLTGAPQVWRKLVMSMDALAQRIRMMGEATLRGEGSHDGWETTGLAAEILSLLTQISYARLEIDRARLRLAGGRLGIVGMLSVLTASRAVSMILARHEISDLVQRHVRLWHARPAVQIAREDILRALMRDIVQEKPDYVPSAHDAYFLERSATLISNNAHIEAGMNTLRDAVPAGDALRLAQLSRELDYTTALINAGRVLIGFSLAAAFCIVVGQPDDHTALSQTALTLTLASTAVDTAQFGMGAMIGIPMAVLVAMWLNFWILPHVSDMLTLAVVFLPQTIFACLLLMNARTATIGFNYGVFFLVILGLGNHHSYDPMAFLTRNIFYLLSAVISFVTLVLLLPPHPKRQRLRMAVLIGRDFEKQAAGRGDRVGPGLLSRKYDRLSQALAWSRRMQGQGMAPRRVFDRLVGLEDFASTLARTRLYLDEAENVAALRPDATQARRVLFTADFVRLQAELPAYVQKFLHHMQADLPEDARIRALTCAAGLQAVIETLGRNRVILRRYGLVRKRNALS